MNATSMQGRWVLLTLVCVAFLVIGQLLFKRAAAQWRVEGLSMVTVTSFFTPALIGALALYGLTTVLWVFVLKHVPLALALPFNALVFIAAPVAAHYLFGESISGNTFIGGALIIAGVFVAVR
jgi:drug/metabolite transporter (DMT)-like permease